MLSFLQLGHTNLYWIWPYMLSIITLLFLDWNCFQFVILETMLLVLFILLSMIILKSSCRISTNDIKNSCASCCWFFWNRGNYLVNTFTNSVGLTVILLLSLLSGITHSWFKKCYYFSDTSPFWLKLLLKFTTCLYLFANN